MKQSPVVHFEMPYKNSERVVGFYSKVFGWQMQELGPSMNGYILAGTTETENMLPKKPGVINGGLFPYEKGRTVTLVTIQVDDINKTMENVKKSGGKVLGDPVDIAGIGKYVSIEDPEGNMVSLLQPIR